MLYSFFSSLYFSVPRLYKPRESIIFSEDVSTIHWTWNSLRLKSEPRGKKEKPVWAARSFIITVLFMLPSEQSWKHAGRREEEEENRVISREERETKGYDRRGLIRAKPVRVFTYVFSAAGNHAASRTGAAYKSELFFFLGARPMSLSSFRLEPFHWTRMIESSNAASYVDEHRPWRFLSLVFLYSWTTLFA